jgi:phosphoribosylamine--glycine ligase
VRVLIVGSGGREHALAYRLAKSARVSGVLCAPGNAGIALIAENVEVSAEDYDGLIRLACERAVDLTVIGPEVPLCMGIVDRFEKEGLRIFGPTRAAARIEGDKGYAKRLMKRAHVPTAEGRIFDRFKEARSYVASRDTGVVVKAAGLAAGKGVSVCEDPSDALLALERIMLERAFGDAGTTVVVEELLKGEELSVFALVDDRTIYVLETAQDHKPVGEGDTGPNTGGMGAYSPAPIATPEVMSVVDREVLVPIVDALRNDGAPYRGLLYVGLMLTAAGPKVLEFNCRFGDPETQPLLMRLESDLFDLLKAVVEGRLAEADVRWSPKSAVCVVMASAGYPGKYESGKVIEGLDRVAGMEDVQVFHAGTRRAGEHVLSSGGRVLGVTALGDDIAAAKRRAYQAVEAIHFENAYYRRDIADKALQHARNMTSPVSGGEP